jgi:hypothetical protein
MAERVERVADEVVLSDARESGCDVEFHFFFPFFVVVGLVVAGFGRMVTWSNG